MQTTGRTRGGSVITYLLHNRQNPRLRIIVPVGTNAQINLVLGGILAIGLHETEQGILRRGGHGLRGKDRGSGTHDVVGEC